ncbi:hypothetical protein Lser_V15G21627 [Lactuca serriola]
MMDLTVEIEGNVGNLEEALDKFRCTEILDDNAKKEWSHEELNKLYETHERLLDLHRIKERNFCRDSNKYNKEAAPFLVCLLYLEEQVNDVKDFIDDYVEPNQEDFDEFKDVDIYNTLSLDKVEALEDLVIIGPPGLVKLSI